MVEHFELTREILKQDYQMKDLIFLGGDWEDAKFSSSHTLMWGTAPHFRSMRLSTYTVRSACGHLVIQARSRF